MIDQDEDEMAIMMVVLEETKNAEGLALNSKDSMLGHRVLNRRRAWGHVDLYDD